MNETIRKFGYPATLVHEFTHWVVLLRPAQPTLGSLILAAKSDSTAFGELPAGAHTELKLASRTIEKALTKFVNFSKINYLMLMMVDPHVHFHVLPRYEGTRDWAGLEFRDAGWPKAPNLGEAVELSETEIRNLVDEMHQNFA